MTSEERDDRMPPNPRSGPAGTRLAETSKNFTVLLPLLLRKNASIDAGRTPVQVHGELCMFSHIGWGGAHIVVGEI